MRIPILEYSGFEADDVIGTIARRAEEAGEVDVVIVSSDKDMLQLVTDRVSMLNPMKDDTWYDPPRSRSSWACRRPSVADLLALKGDSIDNIPGAPGIGDKGARDLIVQFGSVESCPRSGRRSASARCIARACRTIAEQILLSKRLATIDTAVPIEWCLESVTAQPRRSERAQAHI